MTWTKYERVICPVCKRSVVLTDEARLPLHVASPNGYCTGSGASLEQVEQCIKDGVYEKESEDGMNEDLSIGGLRRRASNARKDYLRAAGDHKGHAEADFAFVVAMALVQIMQEMNEIKHLLALEKGE